MNQKVIDLTPTDGGYVGMRKLFQESVEKHTDDVELLEGMLENYEWMRVLPEERRYLVTEALIDLIAKRRADAKLLNDQIDVIGNYLTSKGISVGTGPSGLMEE